MKDIHDSTRMIEDKINIKIACIAEPINNLGNVYKCSQGYGPALKYYPQTLYPSGGRRLHIQILQAFLSIKIYISFLRNFLENQ